MEYVVYTSHMILIALTCYLLVTIARLSRNGAVAVCPKLATGDSSMSEPLAGSSTVALDQSLTSAPLLMHSRPLPRIEGIAQLQMLIGGQMLELRLNGLHTHRLQKKDWLFLGVCHYIHGACQLIASHLQCSAQDEDDMLHFLLRRNLEASHDQATHFINRIRLAPLEDYQQSANRAGQQAARYWLQDRRVPEDYSLFYNLMEWGMHV